MSDSTGGSLGINRNDEYGVPSGSNLGRFGYTGQAWLPEITLNYYKARMYKPELGRFMQVDPLGYTDSANLYAYVRNDPVNLIDVTGGRIIVAAQRAVWPTPYLHLKLVIIPNDQSAWFGVSGFVPNNAGAIFTTVGAASSYFNLKSDLGRLTDIQKDSLILSR